MAGSMSMQTKEPLAPKLLAEALGTFFMVLAGTGAIVINEVSGGAITHVGIALTFGLVVMVMIHTFGDISGCHINPSVTIAFALAGRFAWERVPGYVVAQALGALAASILLNEMYPGVKALGATLPAGSPEQSLMLEIILTFMLMLLVLTVSSGPKELGITAGIAIGGLITLEALFAGPVSGASMNPVRSFAPAFVSGEMRALWVYLIGPPLGAALAVPVFAVLHPARRS